MSWRRIDVSATHVVASLLATVTGAVAASSLGVAGTLIGAAIVSVASTAGAAVYKHYLARSHDRLRKAAMVLAPYAGLGGNERHLSQQEAAGESVKPTGGSVKPTGGSARTPGGSARTARESARSPRRSSPDHVATEAFPTVGDHARRWPADLSGAGPAGLSGRGDERPPEAPHGPNGRPNSGPVLYSAGMAWTGGDPAGMAWTDGDPAGMAGTAQDSAGAGEDSARTAGKRRRSRPSIVLAGVALAVFLLAMGGITAFELVAGKPISSVLFHHGGSGTTVGHFFGGHAPRHSSPAKPRPTTPAPTSRATGTPSPSLAPSQSSTPSTTSPSP
jgi:hypothetical protein